MMINISNMEFKKDIIKTPLFMFSCQGNSRLYATMIKFFQLEDRFNQSNYYLRKAVKLNHNATLTSSNTGKSKQSQDVQNVVRFMYAENAILGYNACYDYILQIVYFSLYISDDFHTRDEYLRSSQSCNFEKNGPIKNAFKHKYKIDNEVTLFYDRLTTFYSNSRKKIQGYANIMKHQGGLYVHDFPQPTSPCVYFGDNHQVTFDPKTFAPEYIEIESLIKELETVSNTIFKFSKYLYSFLKLPWDIDPIYSKEYQPILDLYGTETK